MTLAQFLVPLLSVPLVTAVVVNRWAIADTATSREASEALSGLEVGQGLAATLFAAEPTLANPTNIDVDHLGRIWVCEGVNYRRHGGSVQPERVGGDRIVILSDSDGDGRADRSSVFYQGADVNAAHGICVLPTIDGRGTRALISCAGQIFFLIDDDGDLVADRREILFTGISGEQHDHGIHAVVFGPDGRLYFNFGNRGGQLKDKQGEQVVDTAGNTVNDQRKPYQQGMVFRCKFDGSDVETLGWNFRNSWELAVDSFGTIWQSDNDDDGNRGTRLNFVMEFGNYGFRDEFTGATWKTPRTGAHEAIPLRHWHLNDPGVIPNLIQTGAGSPTGILVYEGKLLPGRFHNQLIHCDAGPNMVRGFAIKKDGAGYSAELMPVLTGVRDQWFRPTDACVAPDGSIFIADWYDAVVGGHNMRDSGRGRLFRLASPSEGYRFDPPDLSNIEGSIRALQSPNRATWYMGWQMLHAQGKRAEVALHRLFTSSDQPQLRARALWLLGQITGCGDHYIKLAINDSNSDIRIVGVRLARLLKSGRLRVARKLIQDSSPQVRREVAILIRHNESVEAARIWSALAVQYDGHDRWYLEALGLSADGQWDRYLDAWLDQVGDDWKTSSGRGILWRSRATKTAHYLGRIISDTDLSVAELPRYFRACDFLDPVTVHPVLKNLIDSIEGEDDRRMLVYNESIDRLSGFQLEQNPQYQLIVNRMLEAAKGSSRFVQLVRRFGLVEHYPQILSLAQQHSAAQLGVDAMKALLDAGELELVRDGLHSDDPVAAQATAKVLELSGDARTVDLLLDFITEENQPVEVQRIATRAICRNQEGATKVLDLAKSGELHSNLRDVAAAAIQVSPMEEIRHRGHEIFPFPISKNQQPVPPIEQLVKLNGDVEKGCIVFNKSGTCSKCHVVNKTGHEIGPNLSEIGDKLSREALLESVLFPNAGVSHGYETWMVATVDGIVLNGILVSQDVDRVIIKGADAIVKTIKRSEIDEIKKLPVSLMPTDLQKLITIQELVDVIYYMQTLKKQRLQP